jgi:hypothetical protein
LSTNKTFNTRKLRTLTDFPNTLFVEVEVFVIGTPAADHGVVRDYAAAFVDISRLRASRRFSPSGLISFGSSRVRLEPVACAAWLMSAAGSPGRNMSGE